MKVPARRPVIGWREWIALPDLGIDAIKAKIDTGARTSALHAVRIRERVRRGREMLEFRVHPDQDDARRTVVAEAELVEHRPVRNSGGVVEIRPVILLDVGLAGQIWTVEVTLTRREQMGFRMLLGRQAVRRRFWVDPGRSFLVSAAPVAGDRPARHQT